MGQCNLFLENEQLGSVSGYEWIRVETVLDSGAAESVALPTVAPWVEVQESIGSKNGQTYQSASGAKIANQGEKRLQVVTEEGQEAEATFQIAEVTRPLSAVSRICDKGNVVVFSHDGGFIQNMAGGRTYFRRENNVYMIDLYMQAPLRSTGSTSTSFHRQSRE